MRNYKLHLIRHGITQGNLEGRYIGRTDLDLTPEAAQQLIEYREEGYYPPVELVYSSPLKRCLETARCIYPDQKPVVVEEMRECDFGDFEGKSYQELEGDPDFDAWAKTGFAGSPKGGESSQDFILRLVNGLNAIIRHMMEEGVFEAAVITHGGAIMMMLSALGLPKEQSFRWMAENGKGYTILVNPQMWMRDTAFEIYDTIPAQPEEEEGAWMDEIDWESEEEF